MRAFSARLMQFYPSLAINMQQKFTMVLLKSFREMHAIRLETDSGKDDTLLIVEKLISVGESLNITLTTLLEWSDKCKQSFNHNNAAFVNLIGSENGELMVPYETLAEYFKAADARTAILVASVVELTETVMELRSDVLALKRKWEDDPIPVSSSVVDQCEFPISPEPPTKKVASQPTRGSVLYGEDTGKTMACVFYNWYVEELWNDILDPPASADSESKKKIYEARSKQRKCARTVKLMHLLVPDTEATIINEKPLPGSNEYLNWERKLKLLSRNLQDKAATLCTPTGNVTKKKSTAWKATLAKLDKMYSDGKLSLPSHVDDKACSKPEYVHDDILKVQKKN